MQCSCRATPPLAQPWGPAVCQVPASPSVTAVVVLGYGDKPLLPSQGAFEPSCSQACICTPPREALPWPAGPGSVFLLNPFPPVKLSPAAWRRWWDMACGFLLPSRCSPEAVGPAAPKLAVGGRPGCCVCSEAARSCPALHGANPGPLPSGRGWRISLLPRCGPRASW